MLQADSTAAHEAGSAVAGIDAGHGGSGGQHSYRVMHEFQEDAAPAHRDSVIKAVFKVDESRQGTSADTFHLSMPAKGKSIEDVNLPQYYREIFFSKDSLLHPELGGGRYGVAGDPVPYTIKGDSTITALLLGCFILALLSFSKSRRFIFMHARNFFHEPRGLTAELPETMSELRFQFFLTMQTCLLLSIVSFLYTQECIADTFILESQYQLIAIFFGVYMGYFAVKALLYALVNSVFFGKKKNARWLKSFLFVTSVEGIMLFPLVMLQSYFDLRIQNAIIYMAFVIILVKTLLLYKSYVIFFRQKAFSLQIILYFCALEIMPQLSLLGILSMIVDYLKINF